MSSRGNVSVSRKEADSLKLKKCRDVTFFRDWMNQSRNDICGKSGRNDDCYAWFKELEDPACTFDYLLDSGTTFESWDSKILAALLECFDETTELGIMLRDKL